MHDVVNMHVAGSNDTLEAQVARLEGKNARVEAELAILMDKNSQLEAELSTLDNRKYSFWLKLTCMHYKLSDVM